MKRSSHYYFLATLWTIAYQASPSMVFSRQEYWNGLPFPSPGYLPHAGIEHMSPMSPELAGGFFTTEPCGKPSRGQCLQLNVRAATQLQ